MSLLAKFHVFLTRVTVDGENVVLVASKYGVRDPLSAVGLLTGLHFRYPSALTRRKSKVDDVFNAVIKKERKGGKEVVKRTSSTVLLDGRIVHFVCEL